MVGEEEVIGEREQLSQTEPEEPASNGAGEAPAEDLFLERGTQGSKFEVARQLFEGDADPRIYLPRTRASSREIARDLRIIMRDMEMESGYIDSPALMARLYNARIGLDGKAREEVVAVAIAQRLEWHDKNAAGGAFGPSRDINRQELEGRR